MALSAPPVVSWNSGVLTRFTENAGRQFAANVRRSVPETSPKPVI